MANTQRIGHSHQVGQRFRLQLGHQVAAVDFDRHFAQADLVGNLFVQQPRGYQRENFALARTQSFES